MTAAFTNQWHAESVAWLEAERHKATVHNQPVVVLTHHTPSMDGTSHPQYSGSGLSCCFSTDLLHLLHPPVQVWACGHTHYNFDRFVGPKGTSGGRLLSNQRGYPGGEAADYDSSFVVHVSQQLL